MCVSGEPNTHTHTHTHIHTHAVYFGTTVCIKRGSVLWALQAENKRSMHGESLRGEVVFTAECMDTQCWMDGRLCVSLWVVVEVVVVVVVGVFSE